MPDTPLTTEEIADLRQLLPVLDTITLVDLEGGLDANQVEPARRMLTLARALLAAAERAQQAEAERDRAWAANERDRSGAADVLGAVLSATGARAWMREGRGSYRWDDDRYQREFGQALDEIEAAVEPIRRIAGDWTDSPTRHEEIETARTNWQRRAEQAEAEVARLRVALETIDEQPPIPEEQNQPRARLRVFDRIPAERKAQLRAIGDLDTALTNALEIDPEGARRMIERHLERAAARSGGSLTR